jgi:hypothetical protein
MASFTSFFYELFFGSNWSKTYCEDPTQSVAAAVLPIAAAVLPIAAESVPTVELAPELLPLVTSSTFKRRRLGGQS